MIRKCWDRFIELLTPSGCQAEQHRVFPGLGPALLPVSTCEYVGVGVDRLLCDLVGEGGIPSFLWSLIASVKILFIVNDRPLSLALDNMIE